MKKMEMQNAEQGSANKPEREQKFLEDVDHLKTEKLMVIEARKEEARTEEKHVTPKQLSARPAKAPAQRHLSKRALAEQRREIANLHMLKERCRQLCLSLFFRRDTTVSSIGFTSSIPGEGKSYLASMTALALAQDIHVPVTLVECNWEHPSLHEVFECAPTPGLAEWLRGECDEHEMRRHITQNLTVIPAGRGSQDAVRLLQQMRKDDLKSLFSALGEQYFILDLPPVVSTGYGALAASLADTLFMVVRSGVTTDRMIAETCEQLKDVSLQGIIMNQEQSHVPNWIRQLM
ncbi:CpsD/CapB family tyrosine-protein kinase [Ktedonobacter robiniae]|uniref:CobQ/CobB/MinD/ParA nucleotide binding domain-containing protein n=1 Tax=Ktedonobacter robiniae TaxID=2778365 RepID=A0ABQ3UIM6_9CHLR|nr:CpsD/CapB family tyrosine-protein kinase [Ktedonobacter robiniae]GHO52460.1 hypothetical protein KSB_09350 [Ktedonobacter robiniae]